MHKRSKKTCLVILSILYNNPLRDYNQNGPNFTPKNSLMKIKKGLQTSFENKQNYKEE